MQTGQPGQNGRNRRSARYEQQNVPGSNPSSGYQGYYQQAPTSWPAPPAGIGQQGYQRQPRQAQHQAQHQAQPVQQPMQAGQYYDYQQPQQPWYPQGQQAQGQIPPAGAYAYRQAMAPVHGGEEKRRDSGRRSGQAQQGGDSTQPPRKGGSFLRSLMCWVLIALIVGGVAAVALRYGQESMQKKQAEAYVASFDDKFIPGVYVDGIHLGEMTLQEGTDAVLRQAQQRNDSWYVRLTYAGSTVLELRAEHLGMKTNITDAINQAWAQGHTGDMQQRLAEMEKKLTQPFEAYTALPSGDTSVIDGFLNEIAGKIYRAPADAQLVAFHPELTDPNTIFEITPERQGRYLDTAALKEQLYQMVSTMTSGDIELKPAVLEPNLTTEDVRKTVSLRADYYSEISTTSTEERTNNVRRAFELINGTVLLPGQEFSFNKIVGKRSTENGFFPAIEYAYGEHVLGVGGGVCQASSTIYIAAVKANLKITEREPHSMEVNYTPYGKDATVNLDGKKIDFKFKNNTDHPIYIVCSVQSNPRNRKRLIARTQIFGMAHEEGVTYDLVTETTMELPIPLEPEYRTDKTGDIVKYKDQEKQTSDGKVGCVVASYSVKYLNGEEIERTPLYTDTYDAQPIVIYRGKEKR